MPVSYEYTLHAHEEQREALLQLHKDYARLCNKIAEALRSVMGEGEVPNAQVADYLLAKMQDELKAVDEETGNRIYPSVYIKLARNRVLGDLADDREKFYRWDDIAVDLDEAVATPKVNKLNAPSESVMTIKLFRSGEGSKYRLRMPYVVKETDQHVKPNTPKLFREGTIRGYATIIVTLPAQEDASEKPQRKGKVRTRTAAQEARMAEMRGYRVAEAS